MVWRVSLYICCKMIGNSDTSTYIIISSISRERKLAIGDSYPVRQCTTHKRALKHYQGLSAKMESPPKGRRNIFRQLFKDCCPSLLLPPQTHIKSLLSSQLDLLTRGKNQRQLARNGLFSGLDLDLKGSPDTQTTPTLIQDQVPGSGVQWDLGRRKVSMPVFFFFFTNLPILNKKKKKPDIHSNGSHNIWVAFLDIFYFTFFFLCFWGIIYFA